jgi:hypothetical protein
MARTAVRAGNRNFQLSDFERSLRRVASPAALLFHSAPEPTFSPRDLTALLAAAGKRM